MLFLSPGLVYRVRTLLHWCDSNAVFIVDVPRVYANSSTEDGEKQNQSVHTHTAFLNIFRVVHEKTYAFVRPVPIEVLSLFLLGIFVCQLQTLHHLARPHRDLALQLLHTSSECIQLSRNLSLLCSHGFANDFPLSGIHFLNCVCVSLAHWTTAQRISTTQ